ncbi:MAG: multidrug effflux MFS transporter [Betaproteobacteria bacterium]|nr:multidrug effflux MFS transporter [Betaproteobacteria bacterium]
MQASSSLSRHAHHATPRWLLALLLAALATLGPFAVDTYMPAFGGMAADLQATPLQMQQTLSVYLAAFAFMFLFHGALSDSYGRKPVILVGLVVFCLSSVGCALAHNVNQLLLFRALQGLSCGAGMVVGRAMIRDLFADTEAQKLMSMVTLWFGLAPAVAPIVGGHLFVWLGWASIFWFMAAIAALLVIMSHLGFHETLPVSARHSFRPGSLMAGYREVGASPRFLLLALALGLNFNAFFLYIVSAPVFLPEHLKLGPQQFAWLFLPSICGIMLGAFISGRVAGRLNPRQTVRRAYLFMAVAALGNLIFSFVAQPSLPWPVLPIFVYAIGSAMAMPSISLIVLDMFPTRRGMAASLQGFVSGIINALVAGLVSPAVSHSPLWLAIAMFALMLSGLSCWIFYSKLARHHRRQLAS